MRRLSKVISGGQGGVDRLALEAARAAGLATGGTAPPGLANETGADVAPFGLVPVAPADVERVDPAAAERAYGAVEPDPARRRALYARTLRNVLDADATVVVLGATPAPPGPGTRLTLALAAERGPERLRRLDVGAPDEPAATARWLAARGVAMLNVAGPRASELDAAARAKVAAALAELFRAAR